MAIVKKWDGVGVADGILNNTTIGAGDTAFTTVGLTPTVVNSEIIIPKIAGVTYVRWENLSLANWSTRCYIRLDGGTDGIVHMIYAWSTTNVRMWSVGLSSSRVVQLRNAAGSTVGPTGPVLALGVRYRFEVRGQTGTDLVTLRVFDASDTNEIYTAASAIGTTLGLLHVQYGRQSSVQFGPAAYSHLQIDNTNGTIGAYTSVQASTPWAVLNSNGTMTALTLNGMWNGTSIIPVDSLINGGVVSPPIYRIPYLQPFASNAPSNVALAETTTGNKAIFEGVTATRTKMLLQNQGLAQINASTWTYSIYLAKNTDPLVHLVEYEYESEYGKTTSITGNFPDIRIPANAVASAQADHPMVVVQPDGVSAYEMYKFAWAGTSRSTGTSIYSTYVNVNPLDDSEGVNGGLYRGSRASGISAVLGMIRTEEMTKATSGTSNAFPHVITMGIPNEMLKAIPDATDGQRMPAGSTSGPTGTAKAVWPARLRDGDALKINPDDGITYYRGDIPMGTMLGIEPTSAMPTGMSNEGKALFHAFQDYGGYILIRAGTVAVFVEGDNLYNAPLVPDSAAKTAALAAVDRMRVDYKSKIYPLLRVITNNTAATIGGGNTSAIRRQPPAPDFAPDNGGGVPEVDAVVCWGDSLTLSTGSDWPLVTLKSDLGAAPVIPVYNEGLGGQASLDIALRQGGIVPLVTLSGNAIPSGVTAVAVTAITPSVGWRIGGTGTFSFTGTLAGISGKLTHDIQNSPYTWTFTRTTSGSVVNCPAQTGFISTPKNSSYPAMISVFWTGRNNIATLGDVVTAASGMAQHLTPTTKRYVVLSMTNTTGETSGTTNYNNIVATNNQLATAHAGRYLDIRGYLTDPGAGGALASVNITPTQTDLDDMNIRDIIPISLRKVGDNTHLNAKGYEAVGHAVADFIKAKGWV